PATNQRARGGSDVGDALDPLSLLRQCRTDILRVRVGIAAVRSGILRHLPRLRHDGAARRHQLDLPMDALPADVRRRADQVARRPLLARADLPRLLLRDATDSERAEL